jgi:microsomal dipeptidase-like Zn-dependent dipeptidase
VFANIHDDRGFEVAVAVEVHGADPRAAFERFYAERMRNSDVWLQFYTVGGDADRFSGSVDATAGTYRRLGIVRSGLPDDFVIVQSSADLDEVRQRKRRGLVLTIEGSAPFGHDLGNLENFHRLGLRSVCLTWFRANQLGDGVGEPRNAGLTKFGRQAVARMEELGLLIDLSQSSASTVADVLGCTERPLIASHSNAAGNYKHVRNLEDDVLRELARRGGIIGLTSYPAHVGSGNVGIREFAEHVVYVSSVTGHETPALGLNIMAGSEQLERRFLGGADIEITTLFLPELEDIGELGHLPPELRDAGLSEQAVKAVCFENAFRVVEGALS